jgi:hypothetical protein
MVRGRASAISLVIAQAEPILETLYVQCAASEYSDLNLHRIGDVIRVEQVPENRRCQAAQAVLRPSIYPDDLPPELQDPSTAGSRPMRSGGTTLWLLMRVSAPLT